jgi:hypothetical protein
VKELNVGWAEWTAAGLPTHGEAPVARGAIRCTCSLHADLVTAEANAPGSTVPPGQ